MQNNHVIVVDMMHIALAAILEHNERMHIAGLHTTHLNHKAVNANNFAHRLSGSYQLVKMTVIGHAGTPAIGVADWASAGAVVCCATGADGVAAGAGAAVAAPPWA